MTKETTSSKARPGRLQSVIDCTDDPGRTQQHFKNECDVNRIVSRFAETGLPPTFAKGEGQYGFASAQTFTEAMHIVAAATSEFEGLPSNVRAHFNNDPTAFLDAADDPERRSEFVRLGLLAEPDQTDPPVGSEPVPPAQGSTDAPAAAKPGLKPGSEPQLDIT